MNEQLIEGMGRVVRILGKGSVVFVRVAEGKLAVSGSTEHHAASYRASVMPDMDSNFNIALSIDTVNQILRHHADADFVVEENLLHAISPSGTAVFSLLDETPRGKVQLPKEGFSISADEFARIFRDVKYAANNPLVGDIRFKGYHLTRKGRVVEAMATDGNVIAVSSTSITEDGEDLVAITNPEFFTVSESIKGASVLEVMLGESVIALKAGLDHGILYLNSTLIKAEALPYHSVTESAAKDTTRSFRIDRKMLLGTLSKLSFFTSESSKQRISLELSGGICTISSNGTTGKASSELPVTQLHDGDTSLSANVSWKYLNSIFSSTKNDTVFLRGKEGKAPLILETSENSYAVLTVFSD